MCTIGVLVLVLIAGSVKMTMKIDPEKVRRVEAELAEIGPIRDRKKAEEKRLEKELAAVRSPKEETARLVKETGDAVSEAARVAEANDALRRDVKAKEASLAGLTSRVVETRTVPQKVRMLRRMPAETVARDEARGRRDRLRSARAERERRLAEVDAQAAAFARRIAEVRKIAGSPEARFAVRGVGADRPPVYVELAPDSLTVHSAGLSVPAGTTISKSEAMGKTGLLATLGSQQARSESSHYVVFLVRPGATELFAEAVRVFRDWHARFGHEPVDAGWKLRFDKPKSPTALPTGAGE
jgi:hypothetical protein